VCLALMLWWALMKRRERAVVASGDHEDGHEDGDEGRH
jgi:hypothetical protein